MSLKLVQPPQEGWIPAAQWNDSWWRTWLTRRGWSDEAVLTYLKQRKQLAITATTGRGKTLQNHIVYAPTPMGALFHLSAYPNLLYGGAAGGAKSYTARHDAYIRMLAFPGARLLLLRRKFTELVDNHLNDARREVARMEAVGIPIKFLKDERRVIVTFPDGNESFLRFGHCEHEGDEDQYLSSEYEAVYPDEAATFMRKQIMGVAGRLRSTIPGYVPVLRCTSNPGGAQTLWLKDWFIDRRVGADEDESYNPEEWGFLKSQLYDNPYLMDKDGTWRTYEKRLTALGPERARQMLEGDWDCIAGQYFSEWRKSTHVRELEIGSDVARFRCMDWGYNAPSVVYWIAALPDGHLHVEHEYVVRQTVAADVAKNVKAQTKALADVIQAVERARYGTKVLDRHLTIRYTAADPSMWNHTGQVGESIAETFARNGVPLLKGSNERVIGWQRLRHWLRAAPDGTPWLTVSGRNCPYLVRTLPALVSDANNPEDVDTTGDDHGADALRYGLMSRPMPTAILNDKPLPAKGTVGHLKAEAVRDAKRRRRVA